MSDAFIDTWISAQLARPQAEREALAARAAQLLDDPLVLKVFSVLEASALRDVVYPGTDDPAEIAAKLKTFQLTKALRVQLKALVDEWRLDARKP